jgi:hypothetical protein
MLTSLTLWRINMTLIFVLLRVGPPRGGSVTPTPLGDRAQNYRWSAAGTILWPEREERCARNLASNVGWRGDHAAPSESRGRTLDKARTTGPGGYQTPTATETRPDLWPRGGCLSNRRLSTHRERSISSAFEVLKSS